MDKAKEILQKYLPDEAVDEIIKLLYSHKDLSLKITRKRQTKLGDFKKISRFQYRISVNNNLNKYQFLITLLHEIAHYLTLKKYGLHVKPHGKEWKKIYGELLFSYLNKEIFPADISAPLYEYAQNPKATTAGSGELYLALTQYDQNSNHKLKHIFELKSRQKFQTEKGEIYELLEKRRTRYICKRLSNGKTYLIHKNMKVLPLETQ